MLVAEGMASLVLVTVDMVGVAVLSAWSIVPITVALAKVTVVRLPAVVEFWYAPPTEFVIDGILLLVVTDAVVDKASYIAVVDVAQGAWSTVSAAIFSFHISV